jgi:hypothetical protein
MHKNQKLVKIKSESHDLRDLELPPKEFIGGGCEAKIILSG